MKKIILILAVSVLLIGCDADVNTVEAEKKTRVTVTEQGCESNYWGNTCATFLVSDKETGNEYIVVEADKKVFVLPCSQPETVLKERD